MTCLAKDDCRAPVMSDGYCYQHSPNIPYEEKQRARSLGGKSSRKIEIWQTPGDLGELNNIVDIKRAFQSLLRWTLEGFITPAQALACKSLLSGLKECIIDEAIVDTLGYKAKLQNIIGHHNGRNGHEQLEPTNETFE